MTIDSTNFRLLAASLACLLLARTPAFGRGEKEVTALAACIDQGIAAAWDKDAKPEAQADDAEADPGTEIEQARKEQRVGYA